MSSYKPDGYSSVSPYFVVDGAQKMIQMLKQIFGGTELRRYNNPDGTIMHVEVKLDDSVVMIADSSDQFPAIQHLTHVYVEDVDATFDQAVSLGCTPLEKPKQRDNDPDKRGSFEDFAGNIWTVSTQVQKESIV